MAVLGDNLVIRKVRDSHRQLFELIELDYESTKDEFGTKESKRIDKVIFTGSITACKAYIDLRKDGWFSKIKW